MKLILTIITILMATAEPYSYASIAISNIIFGNAFSNAPTSTSSASHLLHVSETLKPGDTLTLQGSIFYPGSSVYLSVVTASSTNIPISLNILSESNNVIQAEVPSSIAPGIWKVWVQHNENVSNFMYVNQAHGVTFGNDQVVPGGTFRIYGRNLVYPNYQAVVSFVDAAGIQHKTNVTSGNEFWLEANAPDDLVPGASYTVYVTNGLAGYSLEMFNQVQDSLTVRSGGTDTFNLGVPWASDFNLLSKNVYNIFNDPRLTVHAKGDGVTDDRTAIEDALIIASRSSNGGVVYLPAGTYLISKSLQLFSKTVLEGDGPNATTIIYGEDGKSNFAYTQGSSIFGILNLSIQNPPSTIASSGVGSLELANYTGNPQKEFFLDNVHFNYSGVNPNQIMMGGYDEVLIKDSSFYSNSGSFYMPGNTHVIFLKNKIIYHFGRINLANTDYPRFINNEFFLDESLLTTATESGGVQVSMSKDAVFLHNIIGDLGNKATIGMNFGESILTQDSNGNIFRDVGTVTNVTGQTLSDSTKKWPTVFPVATPNEPEKIWITDGPGLGQSRVIVNHTSTSVTVDKPWDIVPPAGSHYALGIPNAENLFIIENTINNSPKGIVVYSGGEGTVVADNTLTNTGGIKLYGQMRTNITNYGTNGAALPITLNDVLWNTYIANNTVINEDNDPVKGYASITVIFSQVNPQIWGNNVLNTEIRNNTVLCEVACPGYNSSDGNGNMWTYNGFKNIHPSGSNSALNYNTAGIDGSVFEGNTAVGLDGYDFYESPDADQTIIDTTHMTYYH